MIYAINRYTKEHRHVFGRNAFRLNADGHEWYYVGADDEGWISWPGGDNPLPDGCRFEIKTYGYDKPIVSNCPEGWYWEYADCPTAIRAYRPILDDYKEETPNWALFNILPPVNTVCEYQNNEACAWRKIKITAVGEQRFLYWDFEQDLEMSLLIKAAGNFKPIRSEEEKILDEIMEDCGVARCVARTIYEAGYSK